MASEARNRQNPGFAFRLKKIYIFHDLYTHHHNALDPNLNFVLWVCASMHIFSIVIWLGGLMYQSAIAEPIMHFEDAGSNAAMRKVNRRFTGFVWMSAWTLFVTGALMMLLHPNFYWFRFDTRWAFFLGMKQLVFVAMVFYAFGYSRMISYLESPASNGGYDVKADVYRSRVSLFRRISVGLGIIGLLLSAAMRYFG